MADISKLANQLDLLIKEASQITLRDDWTYRASEAARGRILSNRLEAAIERIALPGSAYVEQLNQHRTKPLAYKLDELIAIADGLHADIAAGWTASFVELVHAGTYSDYLEMSQELLGKGYKDPAAVVTGTSLEVHVRALCVKHQIDTELPDGKPRKADSMNADLKKAGVYDGLQQKQITAWMDLRNQAAHGNYEKYDEHQVRLFIHGVHAFMIKYPA
ncbi:hypothetical protein ACIQJ8_04905 [Streptomyces globisporus]|uniref:hypothetical protein n=1 Tax=Streptomyces globisporus TaxID=1908 RepID=UPI003460D3F8|nr:hypothetical protein OG425_07450 [Streptomyces globisporus]